MNFCLPIILTLLISATFVRAQSSPSPENTSAPAADAQISTSAAAPSPSATAAVEPPSLIPANILPDPASLPAVPTAPDLEKLNSFFKQSSLGKAADEHRLHVQIAELETRIRNDENLHARKAFAFSAPTDLERRHRLKEYYQLYFKKLRGLTANPDLKAYLDTQEAGHEIILLQPRVRHQTDEAAVAALSEKSASATAKAAPTPVQARASEALRP